MTRPTRKISHCVFLFRTGKLEAKVDSERFRRSPIPKGGLEIILNAKFLIDVEKRRYLERLAKLINDNYDLSLSGDAADSKTDDAIEFYDEAEDCLTINLVESSDNEDDD